MKKSSRIVSVAMLLVFVLLLGTEVFAAAANNPSSDVAAKSGTGTGKSTTASASSTKKVSNFTSLKRKTALEKKAYKDLKKIEKAAKAGKWNVKRVYTREKLAKKYKKTWVITDVYIQSETFNWTFRHCYHKSGKVTYQWKGRMIAKKDVFGLIKNPHAYYKG